MSGRKWLIGAAVAALAVLVIGAIATRGGDDASRPESPEATSREGTAPAGAGSSAGTGSADATGKAGSGSVVATVPPAIGSRDGGTAADRAELVTVTAVPPATLAVISGDAAADGDRFQVSFRPYGWGPMRSGGRALVIRLDTTSRSPQNSSNLEFEPGQNVLVTVPGPVSHRLEGGGRYTGMIVLRNSSGALALHLEQAVGAVP